MSDKKTILVFYIQFWIINLGLTIFLLFITVIGNDTATVVKGNK